MVQEAREDPHGEPESDIEEPINYDSLDDESDEETYEDDGTLSPIRRKKKERLRPSGVIIKIEVDPDKSDEDDKRSVRTVSKRGSML